VSISEPSFADVPRSDIRRRQPEGYWQGCSTPSTSSPEFKANAFGRVIDLANRIVQPIDRRAGLRRTVGAPASWFERVGPPIWKELRSTEMSAGPVRTFRRHPGCDAPAILHQAPDWPGARGDAGCQSAMTSLPRPTRFDRLRHRVGPLLSPAPQSAFVRASPFEARCAQASGQGFSRTRGAPRQVHLGVSLLRMA